MTVVVAMDGPSGSGKSSTAKAIAKRAGWLYLDTGALYRAATWLAIEKAIDSADELLIVLKSNIGAVIKREIITTWAVITDPNPRKLAILSPYWKRLIAIP